MPDPVVTPVSPPPPPVAVSPPPPPPVAVSPPPPPPAAVTEPTTIASGRVDPAPAPVASKWPDDWRQQVAGEDKAFLKTLERYASFSDYAKATQELRKKISSGETKTVLPENATPEEIAAYRKENKLPEKAEDLKPDLPKGFVLGEADKPIVENFQKFAFDNLWDTKQFNQALGWYTQMEDALKGQRAEADENYADETRNALKEEWGRDYNRNMNAIGNLREQMPKTLVDRLFGGRTADGKITGNDPETLQWVASISRQLFPTAAVVPAGVNDPAGHVAGRITEIETIMKKEPDRYWKGEEGARLQAELRELYGVRDQMKARAA